VMGAEGAVNIIQRTTIEASGDPDQLRQEFIADYRTRFMNPYEAASLGFIDEVIAPRTLRPRLASYLSLLKNKRDQNPPKKHGNIPL